MRNRVAYMTGLQKMEMREREVPKPQPDEVLVKLEYVGICGSDVHYYERGRIGDFIVNGDFVLGHECAGTIAAVGSDVRHLQVGDRVALEPGVTCGQCEFCMTGRYNLCPDVRFLATPPYDGCLAEYIAYPAQWAFKLPDAVSTREGALVEPLSVGLHAARQGKVKLGDRVVILGAGAIGLMTLLASRAFGAVEAIVVDVLDKRLALADKLGATHVIDARQEDVKTAVSALTLGQGADVVFETAGSEITVQQTPYLVKRGGIIVLVGLAPKDIIAFDFMQVMWKEARIQSVFRYHNLFSAAIRAMASGQIDVKEMITHEFPFADSERAFDYVISNKGDVVKAMIKM